MSSPGGGVFYVRGRGAVVEVVVRRLSDLLGMKNSLSGPDFPSRILAAQKLGRHGDVTLKVRVGRAEVIRLRPDSRGNWLAAILGVAPAQVRLGGLIRSLLA